MKFIHGCDIQKALREIAPIKVAVAYVGIDWRTYIDVEKLEDIILSPTIGTNPNAISEIVELIGWEHVHFLNNLHSKIYLGEQRAAVGSFNLTANGLSAEGLQEAGFVVSDVQTLDELSALLANYQHQATVAYPTTSAKIACLGELRALWDRAIKHGAIRNDTHAISFDAYRAISDDEIYICWFQGEICYTEQVVSPKTIKDSASFLEDDIVHPDRWILCWSRFKEWQPCWLHIDELVEGGAQEEPYTKVAIERNDRIEISPPFEITDVVIKALYAVLNSGKFPEFLPEGEIWSLNKTLPRLPDFLRAMREFAKSDALTSDIPESSSAASRSIFSIDELVGEFDACIRDAMQISLSKKYVKSAMEGLLVTYPPVTLAKRLVKPGSDIKSGLKSLAKYGALHLSFESIMLEPRFAPLFNKNDLDCARFNLFEANPNYQPPSV